MVRLALWPWDRSEFNKATRELDFKRTAQLCFQPTRDLFPLVRPPFFVPDPWERNLLKKTQRRKKKEAVDNAWNLKQRILERNCAQRKCSTNRENLPAAALLIREEEKEGRNILMPGQERVDYVTVTVSWPSSFRRGQ